MIDNRPKTGQEALDLLKEGNERYVDSLTNPDPTTTVVNDFAHAHE